MLGLTCQPLTDRVTIVTGATSGIGRNVCAALGAEGARVVAVGRDGERLRQTVDEVHRGAGGAPDRTLGLALDVTREEDMAEMATRTVEAFGRIDALVAAAGTLRGAAGWPRYAADVAAHEWDDVIKTNLTGVFLSNRAVLPAMIRQREGHIVNISSTSGLKGLAYDSAYCASKFGVIGLSQSLAQEVRPFGVRVQVLLPGAVASPMWIRGDAIPHLGTALPVERVSDAIRYLLTLPGDAELVSPTMTPFATAGRMGM
jgi:NAD(P)-dependent dehydrogenase (short-subunit alcohol dehydrogenase family)